MLAAVNGGAGDSCMDVSGVHTTSKPPSDDSGGGSEVKGIISFSVTSEQLKTNVQL